MAQVKCECGQRFLVCTPCVVRRHAEWYEQEYLPWKQEQARRAYQRSKAQQKGGDTNENHD